MHDFHNHMKKYAEEVTQRVKRATKATADYGFVRKPELCHQYGMLFNHHRQVISRLKNMDLFLSIDLPKVEDIAHVLPPFQNVTIGLPHIEQIGINMCTILHWGSERTTMDQ